MTEISSARPSLSTMRLAELQQLASSMGLKGTSRMRKSELIAAIREHQSGNTAAPAAQPTESTEPAAPTRRRARTPNLPPASETSADAAVTAPASQTPAAQADIESPAPQAGDRARGRARRR
ncbi:Rho termination factor N-terminal domain-containing protein, partial [Actinomyces ruminis]|uniref:Rho termination factor N-terminal domain-containing protein n=1 Tax=Actinomyces ruminis TaxID=1937003 RepID=UPI00211E1A19